MANTPGHALALKTLRNLRRRRATKIRSIERDNELREAYARKSIPSFWEFIQNHNQEKTYSDRFKPETLQSLTESLMKEYDKLDDEGKREFRKEYSELLSEEAGVPVRVSEGSSHSGDAPTRRTLHYAYNKRKWLPY